MKKKSSSDLDRMVGLMFEAGTLRKTIRSHRQNLLTDDLSDNIASHSYRTIIIGYLLAKKEKVDTFKVVLMCLIHDFHETRTGDQNWVYKKYVKAFEDEAIRDQFDGLTNDNELYKVALEYNERETKESKIAKDADLLDQVLLLKEYATNGNNEARTWLEGREQEKRMYSKTAKELAEKVRNGKIHCWWDDLWTSEGRK